MNLNWLRRMGDTGQRSFKFMGMKKTLQKAYIDLIPGDG
jgi:hypothetical protein